MFRAMNSDSVIDDQVFPALKQDLRRKLSLILYFILLTILLVMRARACLLIKIFFISIILPLFFDFILFTKSLYFLIKK